MTGISEIIASQHEYYLTHTTRDIDFRIANLKKLKDTILKYENKLYESLKKDLGKSSFEAYASEIGYTLEELSFHIANLRKWAKPTKVRTDFVNFFSRSFILHEPLGVVLVIAPWNYPFQLLFCPLIGAISAGNCVALKPAQYSDNTSAVIQEMITETFDEKYISVFTGGFALIQELLNERFDYIFFTGSTHLGKIVMEKASRYLTPVTLELGGKSPCIVDADANIDIAARRITFGKFLNSGQTCIAPDYLLAHTKIKKQLIDRIRHYITLFYGQDPQTSPDYGRIINHERFESLSEFIKTGTVVAGGKIDPNDRYIAPTLLDNVKPDDPIMQEEIFGPILPVLEYSDLDEVISFINGREKPLALYIFSSSRHKQKKILATTSSGGGCINDTVVHLTNPRLPFGGVGFSGMGSYHGKFSFATFSHHRSILSKSTLLDISLRYAPYKNKLRMIRHIMK
jgi:aldehyde dehydrogenase (NAD+)